MKFDIITLGCKVNIYESEAISNDLIKRGWVLDNSNPDVVIINTCTVTQTSDSKSRKIIRQTHTKFNNALIVVMGCYAQLDSERVLSFDGVGVVIGSNKKDKVYDVINDYFNNKEKLNLVSDSCNYKVYEELSLDKLSIHTRGFVKIQDGCENFCSYCAIPYSRGPIKSRNPQNVINEIKKLVNEGVKEIVLSGINTGTYGQDTGNICLAKLIEKIIIEVPSLYRLRLSSIELKEITDELIATIIKYKDKIANHLHIPLQSGCDATLKRMNRKYNMNEYIEVIKKIRNNFEDIAITTDCLAGFVGETIDEFNTTYKNIELIGFSDCHIFPYSRRKNTVADSMEHHLDNNIIKDRAHTLQQLAKKLKNNYYQKHIGKNMEVLVEQLKDGYWHGHTSNYLEVMIKDQGIDLTNKVVLVNIDKLLNNKLIGKEI